MYTIAVHIIARLLVAVLLLESCALAVELDLTSNDRLILKRDYFSDAYDVLDSNINGTNYISVNFWRQSQAHADKLIVANMISDSAFSLTSLSMANLTEEHHRNFNISSVGSPLSEKFFPPMIFGNNYYIMTSSHNGSPNGLVGFQLKEKSTLTYLQSDRIYVGGATSQERNIAYLLYTNRTTARNIPASFSIDTVDLATFEKISTDVLSLDFCPRASIDNPPILSSTISGAYIFYICQPKFNNVSNLNDWYLIRYEPNKKQSLRNIISLGLEYKPTIVLSDIESAGFFLFEHDDKDEISHLYKWSMEKNLDYIAFPIQNATGFVFDTKFLYLYTKDAALAKIDYKMLIYEGTSILVPKSEKWREFDFSCGAYNVVINSVNESLSELWLGTSTAGVIIEFKVSEFCNKDVICDPNDANRPPSTLLIIEVIAAVSVAVIFAVIVIALAMWQMRVKKEEDQERLLNANINEGESYGTL